MKLQMRTNRKTRGAALVEYGLLVAGVALISTAAVAVLGHKTSDLVGMVASVLPGAHADDNAPIVSGKIVETAFDATAGGITLNIGTTLGTGTRDGTILGDSATDRLGGNLGLSAGALVVEAP